jgi:hypothetical protein
MRGQQLALANARERHGKRLMPSAIEQIVDAYVRLNNRRALEELMRHRQRLAIDLNARSGPGFGAPIRQVNDDIAVIGSGLAKLDSEAAA